MLLTTDFNNHKNDSSRLFSLSPDQATPFFFFSSYPARFIIRMQQKWGKKKKELNVTFHQLLLCAKAYFFLKTPWHFCYGAFFLSPGEISYSIHLCACAQQAYKMCVFVCLRLCTWLIPFVHEGDVQSSKLKQPVEWAIDGSINSYTVLVMSSVTSLSLFYRLNLLYFHPISNISLPSGCN